MRLGEVDQTKVDYFRIKGSSTERPASNLNILRMPVFGTTAVKKTKPLLPSLKTPVTSPSQRRTKPADFNDLSEALRFTQKV